MKVWQPGKCRQFIFINIGIYFRVKIDMLRKKFVVRQLSRHVCTRRIQFPFKTSTYHFLQIMMTLFAALSAGAKIYLLCNEYISILHSLKLVHTNINVLLHRHF